MCSSDQIKFHLLQYSFSVSVCLCLSLSLSLSLSPSGGLKLYRDIIGTYSSEIAIISEQRKRREEECRQLRDLVEELESMSSSKLQ
jgi:hypothetical protein